VASICKLLAARSKVPADEAFLTGLVHGIGILYIMARAAGADNGLGREQSWMELIGGWQASIGQAVLQSWGFAEELCEAVGEQGDLDRRWKHEARLVDILIASLILAEAQKTPEPRIVSTEGVNAFLSLRITSDDCVAILAEADEKIRQVHEALA
jgi:HD-like signal output (HDOD) protein